MSAANANEVSRAACSCAQRAGTRDRLVKWATAGGLLAALGVCAACCLLPFALISAGVASAWVGGLDALAAYKWIFIGAAAGLLGYGFYAAYSRPEQACAAGSDCKACGSRRSVRLGLWVATILAVAGIVFEQLEPYL
jgi:mercuric ion transport protein